MMEKTILIIEDEQQIVEICRDYLQAAGFSVISAADGLSGFDLVWKANPSLVVLDLMLPGMDGMEICRRIREKSSKPVIILTARHRELDKLEGLESGADDYLTKPFSPRELVARIQTVLRRAGNGQGDKNFQKAALQLDRDHYRAILPWGEVSLTPTEFDILAELSSRPGEIFSRGDLLSAARGVSFESYERAIDSHIRNLRRKIDREELGERHIITVHGFGYKYVE
ncbi:response regulator transcription factor [Leptolinea tardivitalis]|nr:response regulator transcription factor [Leptolinea tardivitalis]GAP21595.1 response regulator consisting of a CheY-like receiver domain and a winged-helix DNA-binding domain [Leptolinea tardivitalis]